MGLVRSAAKELTEQGSQRLDELRALVFWALASAKDRHLHAVGAAHKWCSEAQRRCRLISWCARATSTSAATAAPSACARRCCGDAQWRLLVRRCSGRVEIRRHGGGARGQNRRGRKSGRSIVGCSTRWRGAGSAHSTPGARTGRSRQVPTECHLRRQARRQSNRTNRRLLKMNSKSRLRSSALRAAASARRARARTYAATARAAACACAASRSANVRCRWCRGRRRRRKKTGRKVCARRSRCGGRHCTKARWRRLRSRGGCRWRRLAKNIMQALSADD